MQRLLFVYESGACRITSKNNRYRSSLLQILLNSLFFIFTGLCIMKEYWDGGILKDLWNISFFFCHELIAAILFIAGIRILNSMYSIFREWQSDFPWNLNGETGEQSLSERGVLAYAIYQFHPSCLSVFSSVRYGKPWREVVEIVVCKRKLCNTSASHLSLLPLYSHQNPMPRIRNS
jgi:hypothetical protein